MNLSRSCFPSRFCLLRWKSQRSKIHMLAHRFSIIFSLQGLAYGFFPQKSTRFISCNHKQKFLRWLAVDIYKKPQAGWIFIWIFVHMESISYHYKISQKQAHTLKNKAKGIVLNINKGRRVNLQYSIQPPLSCRKEIHRLAL